VPADVPIELLDLGFLLRGRISVWSAPAAFSRMSAKKAAKREIALNRDQ
jgi:hypothetical protein